MTDSVPGLAAADDGILAAGLFSFLLHLPFLVGIGVYVGGEPEARYRDITAIIRQAAEPMRPLSAGETPVVLGRAGGGGDRAGRERPLPPPRALPPALPVGGGEGPFEEVLAPAAAGVTSLRVLYGPRREAAGRWLRWYSEEVRRRIREAFPARELARAGVTGRVKFRIYLQPDGRVKRLEILQAENQALMQAARTAVARAAPFPGYAGLGLDFFPPFDLSVRVLP